MSRSLWRWTFWLCVGAATSRCLHRLCLEWKVPVSGGAEGRPLRWPLSAPGDRQAVRLTWSRSTRPCLFAVWVLLFVRRTGPPAQVSFTPEALGLSPPPPRLKSEQCFLGAGVQPDCSRCANPATQAGQPGPGDAVHAPLDAVSFWLAREPCGSAGQENRCVLL